MMSCWAENPVSRPTFTNLVKIFDSILSNLVSSVCLSLFKEKTFLPPLVFLGDTKGRGGGVVCGTPTHQ